MSAMHVRPWIAGALAAAAMLCVPGCMVGPDYTRPPADAPAAYKEAAGWKLAQPRDEVPRGKWWQIFGDAKLDMLAVVAATPLLR